jgi:hypothetical protein
MPAAGQRHPPAEPSAAATAVAARRASAAPPPRRRAIVVFVLLGALVPSGWGAAGRAEAAAAAGPVIRSIGAAPPQVLSVSASPNLLPASGGKVTVTVRVQNSATCTFGGEGVSAQPVACSSGSAAATITFGANTGAEIVHTYHVTAESEDGTTSASSSFTVTQAAAPLLGYLDVCTPGPACDYGPVNATYQDYGNIPPLDLGDCAFAAAANWEQIVLGLHPDPALIEAEFAAAGGTAANGLPLGALWSYWEHQGIDGVVLSGLSLFRTGQTAVENGVRDYGAMIVELRFVAGDHLAEYAVRPGRHLAVVDGFTPEGPLVVTWGRTLQVSWQQWNAEVVGMWGIATG